MKLTVGIIGAPHGLKGEVKIDVRTDKPELRLYPGASLETIPPEEGPLVIAAVREYKGATYVRFTDISDRNAVETLRGVRLIVESDEEEPEEDAWYPHELVGLEALDPEGYELGIVKDLYLRPAQDLLVVEEPDGQLAYVPFVRDIVREVDIADHCVVIDAPAGLFSEAELPAEEAEDDGE